MQVIIKGGFTYTAEFLIKEEAYSRLLSAAKTFGKDNADAMLGLYIESKVNVLKIVDRNAMIILKNSTISCETHFPSNFVTITACVRDCDAEVDHWHEMYEYVKTTLDASFRRRFDNLLFIHGKLDASHIIEEE